MEVEKIKVSYRDKEKSVNISLGEIEVPRFSSLAEATEYFDTKYAGKGVETCLELIHSANDIDEQRRHRDANRPDRPKEQSLLAKFRQLTPEAQADMLKSHGVL